MGDAGAKLLAGSAGALFLLGAPAAHADPAAAACTTIVHGGVFDTGIGTSRVGDTLMAELGGESLGLRAFSHGRWLLQWDVLAAARAGWLASEHPFLFLAGAHTLAWLEGGVRILPPKHWSPYLGARLGGDVTLMGHPGLASSDFDTINDVGGAGGVVARGLVRVAAGASFLDRTRSLLLVAFAQEAMQARQVATPGLAFTQLGVGARFDLAESVVAEVEGSWGVTADSTDALRGISDQTSRMGVAAAFRKIFHNGMWLGVSTSLERDGDAVTYPGGANFQTTGAPRFAFTLLYGVSLGRRP